MRISRGWTGIPSGCQDAGPGLGRGDALVLRNRNVSPTSECFNTPYNIYELGEGRRAIKKRREKEEEE